MKDGEALLYDFIDRFILEKRRSRPGEVKHVLDDLLNFFDSFLGAVQKPALKIGEIRLSGKDLGVNFDSGEGIS